MGKNKQFTVLQRLKKVNWRGLAPFLVLFILISSYVVFFSILTIDKHNRFATQAYDLGIADQAIWQYSRFSTPFNTVAGTHMLGNHFRLIYILISPLYWFVDDVRALLVLQTLVLGVAALPIYLIANRLFKNRWIPLVFCFSYLLFPAVQYTNLEDFHSEPFALLFILLAFYFIMQGKKWHYLIFLFLALMTKEDIALTMFLVGIYVFFKYDKKTGIFTSIFSLLWYILTIKLFIPFFGYGAYFHESRSLGQFGDSLAEIILGIINPKTLFPVLFTPKNATYMLELFSPVGFLALLNPLTMIISASLWGTLLAAWPYAHSIHYHYSPPIIPFIYISLIIGIVRFKKRKILTYLLLSILIISSLVSNYYIAPDDASIKNYGHIIRKLKNFDIPSERETQIYHMLSLIPKNATVSVSHGIVPHLTHRNEIYMFPNPFEPSYWIGTEYGYPPPKKYVDYLLLQKKHIEQKSEILQPLLNNNTYRYIYESGDVSLLQKQN